MRKRISTSLFLLLLLTSSFQVLKAQSFAPEWERLKTHNAAPEWFADAKFGIYFHWGVYSVPAWGSEWYPRFMYDPNRVGWGEKIYDYHQKTYGKGFDYHDFIPMWKAPRFNAKAWVDLFENAGAKIIGSIAEHHDGFSLWDSKVNVWNSVKMGPKIDVVKEIYRETKKRDLKFMTTFHHGFGLVFYPKEENKWILPVTRHTIIQDSCMVPKEEKYKTLYNNLTYDDFNNRWLTKLNEVIDEFCPDYIWMDFGQRYIKESHRKQFLANYFNKAKTLNKEVVVNTKGSFFPTDLAIVNVERATMEDITPEVWVTDFILGSSWCFNKAERTAIDPQKAIRMMADIVSKNGFMILSAGPMADGTIPQEQVDALNGIGNWLTLYGEAIYNTRPFVAYGEGTTILKKDPKDAWNAYGAIKKGLKDLNAEDVRFTQHGKTVYAIQLGWNEKENKRTFKTFANKAKKLRIKSIEVLGSNETIRWKKTKYGLTVQQPKTKPLRADTALVYKITLK